MASSPQQVAPAEVDQDEIGEAREKLLRNAQQFALMTLFMLATVAGAVIRKGAWLPKYWLGLTAAVITAIIAYRQWKQYRALNGQGHR